MVDLDDIEMVCEVIEAFLLRIELAIEGLGMAVEFLFVDGAVFGRLKLTLSSCDLFKKVRNCGSPIRPDPPASFDPDCNKVKNWSNIFKCEGSLISFNLSNSDNCSLDMNSRISLICFRIRSST